jgi:hypothetical protein
LCCVFVFRVGVFPQKNPAQIQNYVCLQVQKFIFSVAVSVPAHFGHFPLMVVAIAISTTHRGRQSARRVAKHFTPMLIVSKLIEAVPLR